MARLTNILAPYRRRLLNPADGIKPLDFGGGGVTGSITPQGRFIALSTYHPEQGYITLTSQPSFPDDQRYDQVAVRRFRASWLEQVGFGVAFRIAITRTETWLVEDALPLIHFELANGETAECLTFVMDQGQVGQVWAFSAVRDAVVFDGVVWVRRCDYTQLTEGGVLPAPPVKTTVFYDRYDSVGIENTALGVAAFVGGADGAVENPDGSVAFDDTPLQIENNMLLVKIGFSQQKAVINLGSMDFEAASVLERWKGRWKDTPDDPLVRRGLAYGRMCCVPVSDEATCILTDHMLLPLSWNRDSYYVARALLKWGEPEVVRRHLVWLFEVAERVDGFWGRSYLANGKVKDRGYQLDQQLYPLLELADYYHATGDDATYERLKPHIDATFKRLRETRGEAGLYPTEETPGDDPIAYPYHLSSHILFYYTLRHTGRADAAFLLRDRILAHFVGTHEGQKLYAYATDGQGKQHFYHDANDLPTAYAAEWGLVERDDPIWRATMDFAFSPANVGGYYDGRLGSVHTPAAWPLGDAQEMIYARAIGDAKREARARAQLRRAAQWDGALPEAYDPESTAVISRHWFAWPGVLLTN